MSTQHTHPDALREQVRARYAAAATKVTAGAGDCGCGQPAGCGCDSGCCGTAATAEEPGFGAELYAQLDRDQLPDTAVLASLGCGNPTAVAELHEGETVLDLGSGGGIDVLLSARRVGITDVVAEDRLSPADRAERGAWVGCIAGALSKGEYEAGLAAAGFTGVSVAFTHRVGDGLHSAIIKATKPTDTHSATSATAPAGRTPLPIASDSACC
jgi:hypothetical protein